MKYALYVGRWQPFHRGHQWLVEQQLNQGKNVLLAIRDVPPDENQPFAAEQVKSMIEVLYRGNDRVKAIIIPDIESINYGRGVGYQVIEHKPDENTCRISATEIRRSIRAGDGQWQSFVDPVLHGYLEEHLK